MDSEQLMEDEERMKTVHEQYGGGERTTFLSMPGYGEGFWRGREFKDMDTSHLTNVINLLYRFWNQTKNDAFKVKAIEVKTYLDTRPRAVITQHEFRISEEDIVKWARAYGVKIPKTGAGVYSGPRMHQRRVGELFLRWDTSKEVKQK